MRSHRIFALIAVGIACLAGIILSEYAAAGTIADSVNESLLGLTVVESEAFFAGYEKKETDCNPGICFEGVLLPYDKENNRLYLPQSLKAEQWLGTLTASVPEAECGIFVHRDELLENKSEAVRENREFTLYLTVDMTYYEFSLVITGTPVISMHTSREEAAEEVDYELDPDKSIYGSETQYYGSITVLNPDVGSDRYEVIEAGVCYHYKGASTVGFEKKSYSLKLLDSKEKKVNVSLLGMRTGSSWKLNALNTDANRVREITASQIWEEIDKANPELNESGPNMEYVELIVDDEYKGLYCLVEPIDEKQLDLDRNDILYKVIDWDPPSNEDIRVSIEKKWKIQYPVRIRYPSEIGDYERAWYPIQNYIDTFYYNEELDYETAAARVNLENFADMFLFTMTTSASDNCFKNTYYAAENVVGKSYVMKQVPWDLDYTFGNRYSYGAANNVVFDENYSMIYAEPAFTRLRIGNPDEIGKLFLSRWREYRSTFLSTEEIVGLIRTNRDYLISTGAAAREEKRWPDAGVNMDIDYLVEFQENRMEWLDSFFEEWVSQR